MTNDLKDGDKLFSDSLNNNTFFSSETIETPIEKLKQRHYKNAIERNNLILEVIKIKQPISKYELAKICGHSYNNIKQIIKWARAAEFVYVKHSINADNSPVELVYINEEKK